MAALSIAAPAAGPAIAQRQAQMNAAAGAGFARADAAVARQWARTVAAMKRRAAADGSRGGGFGHASARLASRRARPRFRDAQCGTGGGAFAGGSARAMTMANCRARLTGERSGQLARMERQR